MSITFQISPSLLPPTLLPSFPPLSLFSFFPYFLPSRLHPSLLIPPSLKISPSLPPSLLLPTSLFSLLPSFLLFSSPTAFFSSSRSSLFSTFPLSPPFLPSPSFSHPLVPPS
jgi:hypothetical protein